VFFFVLHRVPPDIASKTALLSVHSHTRPPGLDPLLLENRYARNVAAETAHLDRANSTSKEHSASPRSVRVADWTFPWLRHGFSTRLDGVSTVYLAAQALTPKVERPLWLPEAPAPASSVGDLNLGWTKDDDPAKVAENRRLLIETVLAGAAVRESPETDSPTDSNTGGGTIPTRLITVRQVHKSTTLAVRSVDEIASFVGPDDRALREADGLMTNVPGILLGIQTADCVPVLLVDPIHRAVGAFHAGWRGTVARIVEHGVAAMHREFGSRPRDLLAAIGPSIGACCYTVGDEVYQEFSRNFRYAGMLFRRAQLSPGVRTVDLWEANRRQLLDAGLLSDSISVVGECTGCTGLPSPRKYFSHRMEQGFTGRMMSAIGIVHTED
jgi:YfiH family protein